MVFLWPEMPSDRVGKATQGEARSGFPHAAADQNGVSDPAVRLLSSLAFILDFAVALLCLNR